jgi:hypothetical protein
MAFDQLTFHLYPPRWMQQSTDDRSMRYAFGGYCRTVSAVPNTDPDGSAVRLDTLCEWLEARGFTADLREPSTAIYGNGRVPVPDSGELVSVAFTGGCPVTWLLVGESKACVPSCFRNPSAG